MTFSQKESRKFLVFLLGTVVLASGCIGDPRGGQVGTGPGISIQAFEPNVNIIESDDDLQLRFKIQNIGGEEATDVLARLIGINPDEWLPDAVDISLFDMLPANSQAGTPGQTKEDIFTVIAPLLPEGQTVNYNPILRIHYGYRTSVTKPITLVTQQEMARLTQEGKSLPAGQTVVSGGPVSVSIITGNIIRATRQTGELKAFPITIRIDNTGGGTLSPNPEVSRFGEDNMVFLRVELPPGLEFDTPECQAFRGGAEVRLFRGKDIDITCEIVVTNPPVAVEQRTIIMTLDYDYFIERSTVLSVKGTVAATEF